MGEGGGLVLLMYLWNMHRRAICAVDIMVPVKDRFVIFICLIWSHMTGILTVQPDFVQLPFCQLNNFDCTSTLFWGKDRQGMFLPGHRRISVFLVKSTSAIRNSKFDLWYSKYVQNNQYGRRRQVRRPTFPSFGLRFFRWSAQSSC